MLRPKSARRPSGSGGRTTIDGLRKRTGRRPIRPGCLVQTRCRRAVLKTDPPFSLETSHSTSPIMQKNIHAILAAVFVIALFGTSGLSGNPIIGDFSGV